MTSIGIDHVEDLGPTLESIAGEKAGVFRPGRPALIASREPRVRAVLRDAAARVGAVLHELHEETRVEVRRTGLSGSRFRLETPLRAYELETPLPGLHQIENASAAVRAAELLRPAIDAEAVLRGVASVRWPGRLEAFRVRRLDGPARRLPQCGRRRGPGAVPRPGAHPAGPRFRRDGRQGRRGDVGGARPGGRAHPSGAAGVAARRRARTSSRAGSPPRDRTRRPAPSLAAALEELLAPPAAETIIIAGSLYLVGEARALLSGRLDAKR